MRTLKTALLFAVVLFSMAPVRPASPQEGYAYQDRRFRGMNSTQVYQRWLNPVLVDGVLYPDSALPQAPRHYSGGGYLEPVPPRPSNVISTLSGGYTWGSDTQFGSWLADFPRPESRSLSVSVDSRGVAHLAGVLGNGATWNIYYYNNRFDSRRANGFSAPLLIAEGAVSLPSIAASPVNDGVYIVYLIANGSVVSRYLNPSSGTWDAEVSIFPGGGAASYMMPTAKVSDNGVLNVVCLRTQTGAMDIVRFAGGVITSVPGTVYDSLRPGQLVDFRFALYGTQASVVWQYRLPDEGINVDSDPEAEFYERRGGIEASILGAAAQPISNNTDPRIRAWQEVPDVAHAPNGTAHFAWVQARVPGSVNPPDPRGLPTVPPIVYHYAADGTTNLTILYSEAGGDIPSFVAANVIAGGGVNFWFPRNIAPRVVCDQMNRPHVFTGDGARRVGTDWTNRTIRQAIRVPNGTGFTWERLQPISLDVVTAYYPDNLAPVEFGTDMGDQLDVVVDANDRIHIVDAFQYTRTMDPELGTRDPNAMVGVFPGASVNVTNGNLHFGLPLFSTKGAGLNQELGLFYNSREFGSGLLAQGWKLNYEMCLIDHWRSVNAPGSVPWRHTDALTLVMPDGRYVNFRYTVFGTGSNGAYLVAGNTWDWTSGLIAKIERSQPTVSSPTQLVNWGTEYYMTLKNGTVYRFNSNGKLIEITDAGGNSINLTWSAGGLLMYVRDKNNNRTTSFEYEDNSANRNRTPRINVITDPMGREYELVYGEGPQGSEPLRHLAEVRFLGESPSPTWSFEYGAMTQNFDRRYFMKTAATPRGTADSYNWLAQYTPDGRVLAIRDPSDPNRHLNPNPGDSTAVNPTQVTFYYNDQLNLAVDPNNDPAYETVVTNRRGSRTRFRSNARRSLVSEIWDNNLLNGWIPTPTGADPTNIPAGRSPLRFAYDIQSRLTGSVDRWGLQVAYTFDLSTEIGNLHVIDRVDQVTQSQTGGSPSRMIADYSYTTNGLHQVASVTTISVMTGQQPGTSGPRTTVYSYYGTTGQNGQRGQLQSVTYPDCANPGGGMTTGHVVEYQYSGPFGALSKITDEEDRETTFSNFNSHGLPGSKQNPGCTQTEDFQYNAMGQLTHHRLPQGGSGNASPSWTEYVYNGLYQLEEVKLPAITSAENPNSADINSNRTTVNDYDLDGNLTSTTPPAGDDTTTAYNRFGQVIGGSTPDGDWSQEVDAHGNVRTVTDFRGNTSIRYYDPLDRLIESRTPGSGQAGAGGGGTTMVVVRTYDQMNGSAHISQEIHGGPSLSAGSLAGPMRTITTTYDGWARPYQVNGPDAYSQSISSFTEADEVWAVATYGPEAGVGGPVMTYQRAHYTYRDQRGRVIVSRVSGEAVGASQTEATSVTTRTWYDRSGRAISSQDGNNVTVGYEYDNGGRLQYVRDAYNVIVEERIYGDDGLLTETKVCNPASKGTDRITARKRAYTSRKELWKDLNANDIGMTYRYGRIPVQIDSVIDPAGAITKTTYHSSTQRVDEVIEAYQSGVARTTKMNWTDGLPTQTLVYNPASGQNNASHARILDQAGRLQVLDAPQGGDLVLTYNEFGDVVGESEGNRSATHVPDGRGFPTSSTVTVGSVNTSISRFFNGSGIQTSVTAQGLTVWQSLAQPEYPGAGNAAWKGTPFRENFVVGETPWKSQSFTHLADGSPETMADAEVPIDNGVQPANHTWSRDSNGRVNQLRFNGTLVMSVQYTPGGMVDFRQIYNASGALVSRTTYAHDSLGRMVSSQTARTSNNKVLCHVVLEYDSSDRITAKELRHLGVRQEFLYNFRGELTNDMSDGNSSWGGASAGGLHGSGFTNLIGPPGTGNESDPSEVGQVESESGSVLVSAMSVPAWDREYTYDPGGNRTTAVIDGVTTTYTYDSGSRLTQSVTGTKTIAYDYDSVGNLVEKTTTQSGQATIVEEYTYDYMNRMDSYANSVTGASWTYQHWPTGDRYSKRNMDSEAATLFVPRWGDVSTEYGQADLEAEPAFENRYVQGLEIDSKTTRIPASGGRRHYVGDQVGTMLVTLTDDGGREEQCVKDAWGMTIAGDTNDERYGFAQRENDTESGLVHMRHRMYDPKSGRFTQIDPILRLRPTEHYRYAANNPITMNDPMGTNPAIALAVWRAAQEMRRREAQQEAMAVWKERVFGVRRDIGPRQLFPNGLPQIVRIRRSDTALEELLGAREMVDEVEALAYHLASNGASDAEVYTLSFSFGVAKASGVEGVQQFADGRDYGKSLVLDRDVRLNSGERCLAGGTGALQLALPAVRGVTWWRSRAPLSFTANEMIPTDLMSKTQFDKLVKSIRANGLKDPNISYVLIEGEPYVVLGSNRLVACRKLGKTGELVFKEVSLPFKDYKTVDDVVRSAADTAAELAERFFR